MNPVKNEGWTLRSLWEKDRLTASSPPFRHLYIISICICEIIADKIKPNCFSWLNKCSIYRLQYSRWWWTLLKSERGRRIKTLAVCCRQTHYVMHCRLESQTCHCWCFLPAGVPKLQVMNFIECVTAVARDITQKKEYKRTHGVMLL